MIVRNSIILTLILAIVFIAPWLGFILLVVSLGIDVYITRDTPWILKRDGLIGFFLGGMGFWTLALFLPWAAAILSTLLIGFATINQTR